MYTEIFPTIPEASIAIDVIRADNGGGHKGSSERENELHGALNEWVSGSSRMLTFKPHTADSEVWKVSRERGE
jgi:hypothetical protein